MAGAGAFEAWANRASEAFNALDRSAFLALMDKQVEAHPLLAQLSGEPYRGHAGLERWWDETFEAWEYQRLRLDRVVASGDTGVALVTINSRGKASGVSFDADLGMLFRLRDGLCTYFRIYLEPEEALRAAGLS